MSDYKPGYITGKTKVGFYLPDELAKHLRIRAAETGDSQSEIVEQALKIHLGVVTKQLSRRSQNQDILDHINDLGDDGPE